MINDLTTFTPEERALYDRFLQENPEMFRALTRISEEQASIAIIDAGKEGRVEGFALGILIGMLTALLSAYIIT